MIADSKKIALFKNLSEFDLDNIYYDFHNDFDCIKIILEDNFLSLIFRKIKEEYLISFGFQNVNLIRFDFGNFSELKNLTIDNLYRGRFEKDGHLSEFSGDGKSYFYLEFYEGPKMELWCESIAVEKVEG